MTTYTQNFKTIGTVLLALLLSATALWLIPSNGGTGRSAVCLLASHCALTIFFFSLLYLLPAYRTRSQVADKLPVEKAPANAPSLAAQEYGEEEDISSAQPYFWKFAMNNISDFFYAKDTKGHYLGQNKSMLGLYGHKSEQDVLGKTNYDLYDFPRDQLDILEENDLRASYSDIPIMSEEVVPRHNNETIVCESMKCSYRDPNGKVLGMICVSRDITSRKQVELALLESQAAAQAASRAKSLFIANTSHEIRTPLNGILGMLYLTMQTELTPRQRDYLEKTENAARHLLDVINDILDFSKIEAGKMVLEHRPFNVREALTQVVNLHQATLTQRPLKINASIDTALPHLLIGDSVRFTQVLNNLLSNALKFTTEGEVNITCALHQLTNNIATLEVAVQDTGIGLAPDQTEHIFSSFAQADESITRRFGGTGLGLTICKTLVSMMGGDITVQSEKGRGSTFSFTIELPLVSENATGNTAENTQLTPERNALEGRRILLAEDNAINCLIATELLEQQKAIVDVAEDGLIALEKIQTNVYDVVLMDVQMPNMDGLTATRTLRQDPRYAHLPIIAMTAHAMNTDAAASLAAGMQEHITKPIDPQALIAAIVRWLK